MQTQTTKIVEKNIAYFCIFKSSSGVTYPKISSLKGKEAVAEFGAQMTLLEQSVANYLELATRLKKQMNTTPK